MLSVPFSPLRPLQVPKLCKKCAHFQKPVDDDKPLTAGVCTLFGMVNLVDGTLSYAAVTTVRENMCRNAQFYKEKM